MAEKYPKKLEPEVPFDKDIYMARLEPGELGIETAKEVEADEIEWLWPCVIPLGCLTLFVGEAGQGKSTFAIDIAARVSHGDEWPDSTEESQPKLAPKGYIFMLAGEDDFARVIKPKYRAAGGISCRLFRAVGVKTPKGKFRKATLSQVFEQIEAALQKRDLPLPTLIIVDPLNDYMRGTDINTNNEVRDALDSLREFAQKHQIAVIVVHHLNKNTKVSKRHRISGSTAIRELSRAVYIFSHDDSTPEMPFCMRPDKNNYLSEAERVGCDFSIADTVIKVDGCDCKTVKITDVVQVVGQSSDGLDAAHARQDSMTQKAMKWLERQPFYRNGLRVRASEIVKQGGAAGFTLRVLSTAKSRLAIASEPERGKKGEVVGHFWVPPGR
jgi:hypothetical protein